MSKKKSSLFFKSFSIKTILTFIISFSFIVIFLLIFVSIYQLNRVIGFKIGNEIMQESAEKIEIRLKFFFDPSIRFINNIKYTGNKYQFINPIKEKEILNYFQNIVESNEEINSIYYGDKTGHLYMAKRLNDKSISFRKVIRDTTVKEIWKHKNPIFNTIYPNTFENLERGYDPRKRSWYKNTLKRKSTTWSKPYVFRSDNLIGITVSDLIKDKNKQVIGVLAIDYSLLDISDFINTLNVSEFGKVFIMSDDNHLLAISGYKKSEIQNYLFRSITDELGVNKLALIPINEIKQNYDINLLYQTFQGEMGKKENKNFIEKIKEFFILKTPILKSIYIKDQENYITFFKGENEPKIAILKKIYPNEQFPIKIGIIIPEDVVLGSIKELLWYISIIIVIFVTLTLILTIRLSSFLSKALINITKKINHIKQFNLDLVTEPNKIRISEINQINQSYENMKKSLLSFSKFVPQGVVKKIIQTNQEAKLAGEKKDITILFTDIADFTSLTEKQSQAILESIGHYFDIVNTTIYKYNGIVDKFIGDAVMALWGTENEKNNYDAENACRCVIHLKDKLDQFNTALRHKNLPELYTRIGLNSGEAFVGNLGAKDRLNYTAIGDSVNLSSRIEGLNKVYQTQILISQTTYEQVYHRIACRTIDKVLVIGKDESCIVYELLGLKNELDEKTYDFLDYYEIGFKEYLRGNWRKALTNFNLALNFRPNDYPTKLLIQRSNILLKSNRGNWNGIFERRMKK